MAQDSALSFLLTAALRFPWHSPPPFPLSLSPRFFPSQLSSSIRLLITTSTLSFSHSPIFIGNKNYEIQRRRPLATPAQSVRGPGKAEKFHSRKLLLHFRCPVLLHLPSSQVPARIHTAERIFLRVCPCDENEICANLCVRPIVLTTQRLFTT